MEELENKEDVIPKTEKELEQWMKRGCYNFNQYSIGGNPISEGFGIEYSKGRYNWYFTERGKKNILEIFDTEKEIISFAFKQIKSDKWANAHCIGFTESKIKSEKLAQKLKENKIDFKEDKIPYYGVDKPIYRTFVFGCDELKTRKYKEVYFEKK